MLKSKYLMVLLLFIFSGCGVKGRPTPPDEPPLIGRGVDLITEQKIKKEEDVQKKIKNKKNADPTHESN